MKNLNFIIPIIILIFIFSDLFAAQAAQLSTIQITQDSYPFLTKNLKPEQLQLFNSLNVIEQTNFMKNFQIILEHQANFRILKPNNPLKAFNLDRDRHKLEYEIITLLNELLEAEGSNAKKIEKIKEKFNQTFNFMEDYSNLQRSDCCSIS